MSIWLDQLVVTRVEAEESPTGRTGHQTVGWTHRGHEPAPPSGGLSDEERLLIEPRMFYPFDTTQEADQQPCKRVFFRLRDDKVVLAQIVPTADRDRQGRLGIPVAHAVVLASQDFAQLRGNPFVVFDSLPFITTRAAVLARVERPTGYLAPLAWDPPAPAGATRAATLEQLLAHATDEDAAALGEAIGSLLLVAWQSVRTPPADRGTLGLYGSPDVASQVLRLLFELDPTHDRLAYSFDTHCQGGNLGQLGYWAVGLPAAEAARPGVLRFDLDRWRFAFPQQVQADPDDGYQQWLVSPAGLPAWLREVTQSDAPDRWALGREGLAEAVRLGGWLGQARRGQRPAATTASAVWPSFREANATAVAGLVHQRVTEQVGPALAPTIEPRVLAHCAERGFQVLDLLSGARPMNPETLLRWVEAAVLEPVADDRQRPTLAQAAQQYIAAAFAGGQTAYRRSLLYPAHFWLSRDWKGLREALAAADDAQVSELERWAQARLQPERVDWTLRCGSGYAIAGATLTWPTPDRVDWLGTLGALLPGLAPWLESPPASGGAAPSGAAQVLPLPALGLTRWLSLACDLDETTGRPLAKPLDEPALLAALAVRYEAKVVRALLRRQQFAWSFVGERAHPDSLFVGLALDWSGASSPSAARLVAALFNLGDATPLVQAQRMQSGAPRWQFWATHEPSLVGDPWPPVTPLPLRAHRDWRRFLTLCGVTDPPPPPPAERLPDAAPPADFGPPPAADRAAETGP